MIQAYPLQWPVDYPRAAETKKSKFITTLAKAREFVKKEIELLNASDLVISTNVPVNQNGDLRSDYSRYRIDDQGAAVYFTHKKNQVCLCCNTYDRVEHNLHAIGRTIKALRQIDRDGVSDFLSRAFTGFKALPVGSQCWAVLGIEPTNDHQVIKNQFRLRSYQCHPDHGGSQEQFAALQKAYNEALQTIGR